MLPYLLVTSRCLLADTEGMCSWERKAQLSNSLCTGLSNVIMPEIGWGWAFPVKLHFILSGFLMLSGFLWKSAPMSGAAFCSCRMFTTGSDLNGGFCTCTTRTKQNDKWTRAFLVLQRRVHFLNYLQILKPWFFCIGDLGTVFWRPQQLQKYRKKSLY